MDVVGQRNGINWALHELWTKSVIRNGFMAFFGRFFSKKKKNVKKKLEKKRRKKFKIVTRKTNFIQSVTIGNVTLSFFLLSMQ